MSNLFILTGIFLASAVFYRFRVRIFGKLAEFDRRNVSRRADELRARFDKRAHYRQTVQLAEEQVEEVIRISVPDPRTGTPVARFLFEGIEYASLSEAEVARRAAILAKARQFYVELDRIYLGRRPRSEPTVEAPSEKQPSGAGKP